MSGTEGLPVRLPSPRIHEREEEVGIYSSTAQRLPAVGVKICHVKLANKDGIQIGIPADSGVLYNYLPMFLRNILLLRTRLFDLMVRFYIHIV